MPTETTGERIRAARTAAKLSQSMLASKLKVTTSLVSHWEADRRPPTNPSALAEALGVDEHQICPEGWANPASTPSRASLPLPADLPVAQEEGGEDEPWVNLRSIVLFIKGFYAEMKINNLTIYAWINDPSLKPSFPAYVNPLRKNFRGEPTLLFKRSEVKAWFCEVIKPLKAS